MELKQLKRLMKLNIFIYGMRGLGVEITKNIVLAGPNKVTIYDPNISKINDLTSKFLFIRRGCGIRKKKR